MEVLLIEDNEHKRNKMISCIMEHDASIYIEIARSFNSARRLLESKHWGLVLIDMSLPAFDRTTNESGGRVFVFGGLDLIRWIKRKNIHFPFAVVTQFTAFGADGKTISVEEISKDLSQMNMDHYLGTILFDSSMSEWRGHLTDILDTLRHDQNINC